MESAQFDVTWTILPFGGSEPPSMKTDKSMSVVGYFRPGICQNNRSLEHYSQGPSRLSASAAMKWTMRKLSLTATIVWVESPQKSGGSSLSPPPPAVLVLLPSVAATEPMASKG